MVRGLLVATGIAAIFVVACMVPSEGKGNVATIALYAVRFPSFCAALAAPFERALAGMCVGFGFFLVYLVLVWFVSGAVG
jgi:hypothetical protein